MIATIILLVITCLGTGVEMAKHGQETKRKYNIWHRLIYDCILLVLFYYAGIFNNFN